MFKESFKYYKSKCPPPNFKDVIDFDALTPATEKQVFQLNLETDIIPPSGVRPCHTWKCFKLHKNPGIIVIRSPFTDQSNRYWIARCLRDFPQHNKNNLSERLFSHNVLDDWWRELQQCKDENEARRIKISMRWTTLGYHHDWDTKVYSEAMKSDFPMDLYKVCEFFASVLGFDRFQAQAAIVNYYPIGTTLAGHTDHSEKNLEAPLFSFSFGQTAIFLIGGTTKDEQPTALFLKNGDVLVMSRESRICFHAVPRVMKATEETWNEPLPTQRSNGATSPILKRLKVDENALIEMNGNNPSAHVDYQLYQQVCDEAFWQPFKSYLNDSRININVRQVLNEDDTSL